MSATKSRKSLALFLMVVGMGLAVSGQILWTRYSSSVKNRYPSSPGSNDTRGAGGDEAERGPGDGATRAGHGSRRGPGAARPGTGDGREEGGQARASRDSKTPSRGEGMASRVKVTPLPPKSILLIFSNRSSRVTSSHRRRLRALIKGRSDGAWEYLVTAYAGERSSRSKNRRLARRRGRRVARLLRKMGVPKGSIKVERRVAGKNNRFQTTWRKVEVATKPKQESP